MAVIGWILIGILGLLLGILLLVLFFPISYRMEGSKGAKGLECKAAVKWLFGLLQIRFDYPEPAIPEIKAFFFTLNRKKEKQPKKTEKTKKTRISKKSKNIGVDEKKTEINSSMQQSEFESSKTEENIGKFSEGSCENPLDNSLDNSKKTTGIENADCISSDVSPDTVSDSKPKQKKKLSDIVNKTLEDVKFYWNLWQKEETRSLVSDLIARVLKLVKGILPRRINGEVVFGAATPDVTGYVFAVYSVARFLLPRRILFEFVPDFEQEIFEGKVRIKGSFTLSGVIWLGIRVLLDKRIWKLKAQLDSHNGKN